jgi:hypothetical protein
MDVRVSKFIQEVASENSGWTAAYDCDLTIKRTPGIAKPEHHSFSFSLLVSRYFIFDRPPPKTPPFLGGRGGENPPQYFAPRSLTAAFHLHSKKLAPLPPARAKKQKTVRKNEMYRLQAARDTESQKGATS